MKNLFTLLFLSFICLNACKEAAPPKPIIEKSFIEAKIDENGKPFIEKLDELYNMKSLSFYKSAACDTAYEDIKLALCQKEVIQVPDQKFPGEFKDSVVIYPYDFNEIKTMTFNGTYEDGKLISVDDVKLMYDLVVGGQVLGTVPMCNFKNEDLLKNGLLPYIEKLTIESKTPEDNTETEEN